MKLWPSIDVRRRTTLALVTVMFLASWVALLVRLTRYWHDIPHEAHHWAVVCVALPLALAGFSNGESLQAPDGGAHLLCIFCGNEVCVSVVVQAHLWPERAAGKCRKPQTTAKHLFFVTRRRRRQ